MVPATGCCPDGEPPRRPGARHQRRVPTRLRVQRLQSASAGSPGADRRSLDATPAKLRTWLPTSAECRADWSHLNSVPSVFSVSAVVGSACSVSTG